MSVIVPALNEEDRLSSCLDALERQHGPLEIIVVDGGSTDRSREIAASRSRVRLIASQPGRARQLNAGARASHGPLLWFVHADCVAACGSAAAIRATLSRENVSLGAFRFALDAGGFGLRLIEAGVRLRCAVRRTPYGDQGLFVRRATFDALGGFPDVPLLEDLELVRAARRLGRVALLDLPLVSSARRWREEGLLRTTARHQAILLLHRLGFSHERIRRWLGAQSPRPPS